MLKIKKVSEVVGKRVYTDTGEEFGEVEEANLMDNKIDSWRIRIKRGSGLANLLGAAKGVVIPHHFVKAIGDVMVINKAAIPTREEEIERKPDADRAESSDSEEDDAGAAVSQVFG